MSGHSKWHSIKHKKGAADAQRGKIFTKHAKLISIVARHGADPDTNPSLRAAIDNAKADNVPNTNIDRAIKKGSGQDKDATNYEELFYEGFGPAGTALYVHVITDNRNRALSEVKAILTKKGGGMGAAGSAAWMFNRKGLITVPVKEGTNADDLELMLIDSGAEDIKKAGEIMEVYTDFTKLALVKENLMKSGIQFDKAEVVFIPKQTVKITDPEDARKVLNLVEMLEENDEVSGVYCNFDIDDELMEKIA